MSISYFPTERERHLLYREGNIQEKDNPISTSCNDADYANTWITKETKYRKKLLKKEYLKLQKQLAEKESFCIQYQKDLKEHVDKLLQHLKSINYTTKTVGGNEVRDLQLFFDCDYNYKDLCKYYIGGYIVILSNRIDHDLNVVGKIETIGFIRWDIYGKNLYGIEDRNLLLTL